MTDDGLTGLSREELLELVRRQQDALAEREVAIERRDEKIRELEEELAQFRQPAKTPENSSVPPSQARKANRVAGRRKLGPKRGHVGVSRVRSEPDIVVECRPRACAGCGEELPPSGGRRTGRSQVTELPVFAPVVIEAWQYTVACEQCGEQTAGLYPVGLEPRRTFGPNVEALLSYFHERHHVSYERLVEVCRDVFGLAISQGGVENALSRWVERARPTYAAIREQVRGSPVINSDETSARVAGRNHWQWVFQTPEASYHVVVPSRGGEVIDAFLAGAEPEVWGSDLWARQILTSATEHQICLSHQERDLTFAVDADTDEARLWAIELRHVFGRAIRLHHERTQVTSETFARRRLLIENATDRLVFDRYVAPRPRPHGSSSATASTATACTSSCIVTTSSPPTTAPSAICVPPSSTARSSAASAPLGAPRPRPSAPPSSPPPVSKPGTSWTPSAPSLDPRRFTLSRPARSLYVGSYVA